MSVDLSQFIPTFLEESFEGLELMESSLLDLDGCDEETINAIFRAAHSIKGGAGTFGFNAVSEFTHIAETLLDEMRSGRRSVESDLVNLLLEAVDCIRSLLEAARDGADCDDPQIETVAERLKAALEASDDSTEDVPNEPQTVSAGTVNTGWTLQFIPQPQMLETGNEPLLMFQALADLGELTVVAVVDQLPELQELVPQTLYIQWQLELIGDCTEAEVREVFEWVEDECELILEPLDSPDTAPPAADVVTVTSVALVADSQEQAIEPVAAAIPTKEAVVPKRKAAAESSSIRVDIDKVDALINRVGELVITQSMLSQVGHQVADMEHPATESLYAGLSQLERNTRDLQEEVMRIRMMPISFVFNRFPRMVHDISGKLGKQVELKLSGEQTELDKTVMEKIGDPMVHLVRNSLDHGLETPADRREAGKDECGTVQLNAYHQGGYIVIEISDDGRGLNTERILEKAIDKGLIPADNLLSEREINELVFMPGFSTADEVSDLSGRGVGMDVVRRNIESLGGHVSVKSEPGVGSTFTISLPLTLAILDGQLIRVGEEETCVIPLVSIVESQQVSASAMKPMAGQESLYRFRDEYIPLIHLQKLFQLPGKVSSLDSCLLVIVEGGGTKVGLLVDELLGQQQVVIRSLESNYRRVQGLSGATILGDGSVALIIDIAGVMKMGLDNDSRKVLTHHNRQRELLEEVQI